jgi:hypothetical protein
VQIKRDGSSTKSGASGAGIEAWDYRRTILRQDEVAKFIQNTKGEKYSALLPLLGLQHLEVTAENLRKLAKAIEAESKLKEIKATLDDVSYKRKALFGEDDDNAIASKIEDLHSKYCPKQSTSEDMLRCNELIAAINEMISRLSADQRKYLILKDISDLKIAEKLSALRDASEKMAASAEPLIAEKLQVLESASSFSTKLNKEETISCPACGQSISAEKFASHVTDESLRLKEIIWPAPGSEDTKLGVLMEPEVRHGASEVYTRVQA